MILVYKGNVKRPTPTILSSYYKGLILYVFVTASYDYNHHPFWCLTNRNMEGRCDVAIHIAVYLFILPHDTFAFCDLRLVRMYWANSEQVRIMRSSHASVQGS